jgi:hypothetical protein
MRSRVSLFFLLLICASPAVGQINRPVLISQPNSTRAIAFESPTYTTEPFGLNSRIAWSQDQRTRVMLFVMNLKLDAGEDPSVVTADAEDFRHEMYTLKVEAVVPVPGQEWVSAIVLRLSDDLRDVGDVLVRVTYRGISSNRVRIGILHVGGGPPDDEGAVPTPAPSYIIGGRVLEKGLALAGVQLTLSGTQNATTTTDNNGAYSFIVAQLGNYAVTPSSPLYTFSPQAAAFNSLNENREANFTASRITYSVSGQLKDESAGGVPFTRVTLSRNSLTQTTTTDAAGNYSFTAVEAGYDYTLTPDNSIFDFAPRQVQSLTSNLKADFQAGRRRYLILVKIAQADSSPIINFGVKLVGGGATQTGMTDHRGIFTFTDVEAGHDYTITPDDNRVLDFLKVIPNFSSEMQLVIEPVRRQYKISGRVLEGIKPIAGATVSLSGSAASTVTTDTNGFYMFTDIQAGRAYAVGVSKALFTFDVQSQSTASLEGNQEINFQGTPTYSLSGRVTDIYGSGIGSVNVTLAGAESGAYQTGTDGQYSFVVHSTGDYTLSVASSEQGYFTFAPPVRNLKAVDGDRVTDFKATFQPATDPLYVLEFDGTPKTVDCDFFWPDDRPLGHFFWEVWGQPGQDTGSRYMISDGYGGAHAILFGFGIYGRMDPGRYEIFGDFWNGSEIVYFGGDDGPAVGEWGHFSVGWDGRRIITYFNGVPVGRISYSGQRWCAGYRSGAGKLLLGGSDHNNLSGRLAQVRGYEDENPREATSVTAAFAPESLFTPGGNYLGNFFRPSETIADLSRYFQGQMHRGRLRGTLSGVINECPECPKPQFVIDPTAPKFTDAAPVNQSAPVQSPAPPPTDALIFDSFSRANSTYAMGKGGLGETEGGRQGHQRWRALQTSGRERFGILNGRAVVLANEAALAWVPTGSGTGNVDIQVQRRVGEWGSGYDTGLAFRVVDEENFFFAYTSGGEDDPADVRKLTIGYYLGGVRTELVKDLSVPGYWTQLEVISHNDGLIKVMTDQGFVYSINSSILANATGAGLFNNSPGLGLLNRWDNFTVYDAP